MVKGKKEVERKTIQLGLRIDLDLMKKIEEISEYENIDKMSWMRKALATFLKEKEQKIKDDAIEDYINLRIDAAKLKKLCEFKAIPKDVEDTRKELLNKKRGKKK